MSKTDKLTDKQHAFVLEYVKDYNATQAAIRAGYAETSAHVSGYRNMQNDNVRQAISDFFETNVMSAIETLSILSDKARNANGKVDDNIQLQALREIAKYHNLTNNSTVKIDDWRSTAIEMIQRDEIDIEVLRETCRLYGEPETLAEQLFKQAGVSVTPPSSDS